ncbi:TIM barrel protein [Cellulophaga lytica]|uniref:hydroxypyruvate isomerase family protein n=1 Tax=Cellulophaga lytica TaxID=979 RepID=UPI0009528679|nr:TIM barrel protein [Cellulophaga lytica]MDO6854075.1 TIM barrel protein [Cellulophaga lytica]
MRNNINHSVCQWCFNDTALEDFLVIIKDLGVTAIDLIGPKDWPLLAKHNIHCAMCNGAEISLEHGWNNPEYHHQLIKNYTELIPQVAAAGYTNLICFSGNNDGLDKETGMQNCINGLSKIIPLAEKHSVVLQMELFNQADHPDYMCDSTEWGVALCKKINSPSFKLLFDIYHMQIQEGNIIKTIQNNYMYFGHYHTAGVPGRNEINHTQELNYSAIMKAILATGFTGYVAQEFIPVSKNKIQSLRESFLICDV